MFTDIDIGFVQKTDPEKLHSRFFPSKVGGKPAWLALEHTPVPDSLLCSNCQTPTIFFIQIYAPVEEIQNAFHRTIFVFICRNKLCTNQDIKIFRNQLGRYNKYYPSEPPNELDDNFDLNKFLELCSVCGCSGPKQCSKCKSVRYCSKQHQIIDWKNGHKQACTSNTSNSLKTCEDPLFEEFELSIEAEELEEEQKTGSTENLNEYQKLVEKGETGTLADIHEEEFLECSEVIEDKTFAKFKKRIEFNPAQVLRYKRNGSPLFISTTVPTDIPSCERCGSERTFEFQILPQILFELNEEDVDFGTILVYTCSKSCDIDTNYETSLYKCEFAFKQMVS